MRLVFPLWLLLFFAYSSASPAQVHRTTRERGVEILWDQWGVPHIFAKSTEGMFWGSGWAQTEAHGDLLLKSVAASRGRASEFFGAGPGDVNLKDDQFVLTNEIPQRAAKWLQQQHPEFRSELDAFVAGVNAYASRYPQTLSESSRKVLPLHTVDVIAVAESGFNFEFMTYDRLPIPERAPQAASLTTPNRVVDKEERGSNGWAIAPRAQRMENPCSW